MSQFLINENMKMPAEAVAITGGSILGLLLEAQRNAAVPPVLSAAFGQACDETPKILARQERRKMPVGLRGWRRLTSGAAKARGGSAIARR